MAGAGKTLSIVIASCNQLNSLKFTLLALRDQMPDIPTEIIVVDNASNDGTGQFLVAQGEKGALRVIMNRENLGRTRARNEGAKASKGCFVMFMDPGMIPGPGWWYSLISTLQMDPQVGAVAGKIIISDGRIDHAGLAVLEWGGVNGGTIAGRSINAGKMAVSGVSDKSLQVQGLAGEAIMVRASAFFAAGGFNAYLGMNHNEEKPLAAAEPAGLDLSLRLKERGWNCVFRNESIMTRLRVSERKAARHKMTDDPSDPVTFSDTWLGRVRPDFIIVPGKGTAPTSNGTIRPYVEPVITFTEKVRDGLVNLDARGRSTVSIIVRTHNDLPLVRICINSLLTHTEKHHELILVDNASTDGTPEYLLDLAADNPQIKTIFNDKNLGFSGGNNVGLAVSEGDHIVLLDSSAVVTAGWLERMLEASEKNPRAGLLGPVTNNVPGLQNLSLVNYNEESMRSLNEYAATMAEDLQGQVIKATRLSGFCLMIKRELMARIGGLDERFGKGKIEDNDYCLRTLAAGYDSLIVRSCYVHNMGRKNIDEAGKNPDEQIMAQWNLFKAKWGISQGVAYNDPVDMRTVLEGGFNISRHFCPLPGRFGNGQSNFSLHSISYRDENVKSRETLGTVP